MTLASSGLNPLPTLYAGLSSCPLIVISTHEPLGTLMESPPGLSYRWSPEVLVLL